MMTISRTYTFEAAHFLPRVPEGHKCGRMHGHSYRLTVAVRGEPGADGWVMDFAEIDAVVSPIASGLDHSVLNDRIANPTSEALAAWFAAEVGAALPLAWIEVSETERSAARWEP
jgi:6-pyruvoyltetrahydropterin/6-carboxytetrahydropterin synthase